ncbi:hypothetical protein [Legionella donaldsonii]|uniref:hypothetical protein n=1 Tax=Legionella donaldsonii TaxID=45060 RepID=UPI00399CE257
MKFFSNNSDLQVYYSQKAIDYTLSKIKTSTNQIPEQDYNLPSSQEAFKKMNQMREIEIAYEMYSLEWINEIAVLAEEYGVGNCCEKACVAYLYLYKKFSRLPIEQRPSIELFNNPVTDHFFVVIGRLDSTLSSDPRAWNPNTVICDSWAEESFSMLDVDYCRPTNHDYQIIKDLIKAPENEFVLQCDVLAKANNDKSRVIIPQDRMVLRSRLNFQKNDFQRFNTEIPMAYEMWDYPKPKHYEKQKRLDEAAMSFPQGYHS